LTTGRPFTVPVMTALPRAMVKNNVKAVVPRRGIVAVKIGSAIGARHDAPCERVTEVAAL